MTNLSAVRYETAADVAVSDERALPMTAIDTIPIVAPLAREAGRTYYRFPRRNTLIVRLHNSDGLANRSILKEGQIVLSDAPGFGCQRDRGLRGTPLRRNDLSAGARTCPQ